MIRRTLLLKKLIPASLAAFVVLTLTFTLPTGTASAHEHRAVHDYTFIVGFIQEPAFEGLLNAVSVRITKMPEAESGGHGMHGESKEEDESDEGKDAMSMSMAEHGHDGMPVEGLQSTLIVEVTHASSGAKREMALEPVRADPGHYTAYFIPNATGQYIFRFVGSIEGNQIDETFESGPSRFADIEPADAIQFPESAASMRELESGLRGALESAQQAQSSVSTATTLAIAGIVVGAIGIVVGGIGMTAALRRRG